MKTTNKLPTPAKIPVGSASRTSTPQESNLSEGARVNSTSLRSPRPAHTQDFTPVGSQSLQNLTGKKLPTRADALNTMALVAVSTLNWLLVRLLYLELGTIGKSTNADYYEIRLPTSRWEHDGRVFRLVDGVGNPEDGK